MNRLLTVGVSSRGQRFALTLGLSAALILCGGCKKQPSDSDAIRAGILQHLNGMEIRRTLKLSSGPRPARLLARACRSPTIWKNVMALG